MTTVELRSRPMLSGPIRAVLEWARAHPLAALAGIWLALVVVGSLAAPLIAGHGPLDQDLSTVLSGPTGTHPLGTDELGRDLFSRLLYGGRATLVGVGVALLAWLLVGGCLGLLAGYRGATVDRLVVRVGELVVALPAIIVLLVVLSVFANNEQAAMVTFGLIASAGLLRVVRGATLSVRQEEYVTAARVSGLSGVQITRRHIVPRIRGLIIVQGALFAGIALVTETGLAFLGFGAQPPAPSWGGLVADASGFLNRQPWLLVPPSVVILLTIVAFAILGDAVRDSAAAAWAPPRPERRRTSGPRRTSPRLAREAEPASRHTDDVVLAIRHLDVSFPVGGELRTVVQDVSLDIRRGETLGLVGESGSGKTVTALAALGLVPGAGRITGGSCFFDGKNLVTAGERELARIREAGIGFVAQDPLTSLDPNFTVGSLISEAVKRHSGLRGKDALKRTVALLEDVNLPDPSQVARRRAFELSGGMAQRVAIALALAGEPGLLIADEPTTALDVTVQAQVLALLRRLQRERDLAILLVTHDWGVVASACDWTAVMYAGQIVEQGAVDELFGAPLHPYTQGLLAANPHLATKGRPLAVVPGTVPPVEDWPSGCHFSPRCPRTTAECAAEAIPLREFARERRARCIHIDAQVEDVVRA